MCSCLLRCLFIFVLGVLCSAEENGSVSASSVNPLLISITTTGSQEIGSIYTLQCIVTSVNTPMIIWENSTDIISNTSAGIEVGSLANEGDTWSVTLTFNPLLQSHDGEYVCTAYMNFDESDITNETISVDVIIPQLQVSIDPESSISVVLGESLTLECQVTPPESLNGVVSSITWEYGDSNLSEGVTTVLSEGMSSLDLDTVVSAEAGVYTCSVQVTSPYLDIDHYLSANSTVTVFVNLPVPSEPIIAPQPIVRQYFSGVEIRFTCFFTIDKAIGDDTNAVVTADWRKGDSLLTGDDDRLSVMTPELLSGEIYFGQLDFDYLTQLDSDNYSCEVFVTSNVNSEFITDSSVSSSIMINVEGPTPDIILTSSTLRLPTHPDYNQATLICTATLPLPPEIDELQFDKEFTWTMSGTDVTSDATIPTDPRGIESVSTLTRDLTIAGDIVFSCEVNISVTGDPVVSNSSSVTITVLGPSNPVQPTDLTVVNINYTEATIQWTVTSIAYTPEQYIVLYGLTESSLTQESDMVNSTMELNNIDESYSVVLTGLTHNTVYYYQVRSTNTEGSTNSDVVMFTTLSIFAPTITTGPSDANVIDGESVSFTCTVFSVTPVNLSIFWQTTANNNTLLDATTVMTSTDTYTSTLMINSVDVNSTGDYTCVAMNDGGMDTSTATLIVIILTISPESVNVSYGATVTLTCEVQSLTTPTVTWTSNTDVDLTSTSLVSSNYIHTSILTLEQVTLEYIGEYTCTAVNEGGEISDMINVNVYVPPPELLPIPDQTVTQGLNVTFTCIATVGFHLSYLWTIPHLNCVDCGPVALNVPTITLTDITNEANGLYTCTVTDFINQTATTSAVLTVAGPVILDFSRGNFTLLENNTFTIYCVIQNRIDALEPLTIRWFRMGYFLNDTDIDTITITTTGENDDNNRTVTSTVFFNPLVPSDDKPNYRCQAYIGDRLSDKVESDFISLNVKYTPFFAVPQLFSPVRINLSESAFVSCRAEGNPDPTTRIEDSTGVVLDSDPLGWVNYEFQNITYDRAGNYRCIANNTIDSIKRSRVLPFEVIIQDRPDMVDASTVIFEFLSFFTIRITWERPNDNFNEINEYQLKIVLLSSISPSFPTAPVFEFNTPQPDFNYAINITACNDVGCGDVSETVEFTSITPGLAKLTDVRAPRALINATSFFLIWAYPELAVNPPNGDVADIREVQITYKPEADNEDTVTESFPSLNVTIGGLFSDRIYTITVLVVYDRPDLIGEGVVLNIQTLPEDNQPEERPQIDQSSIADSVNPHIDISWNPLPVGEGGEYLQIYVVEIRITNRAQRRKRAAKVITFDVDKDTTSFQYIGVLPFTTYITQVFANLIIDGRNLRVALTSAQSVDSPESDNQPEERPQIDQSSIADSVNPHIDISWNPLPVGEGGEYLQIYVVEIRITNRAQRRKRAAKVITFDVDKDTTSFQYIGVLPFTTYITQVFANLIIDGRNLRVALTSAQSVDSPESAPTAPRDLQFSDTNYTRVTLTWNPPESPNGIITNYIITRVEVESGGTTVQTVSNSPYIQMNLIGNREYMFKVKAATNGGIGPDTFNNVTTLSGVFPPSRPAIRSSSSNHIIVSVQDFSTLYGPLSHYQIVVVSRDNTYQSYESLYPYSAPEWEPLGYYVTATFPADMDNTSFTVGDGTTTEYNEIIYENANLQTEVNYRIFIRVYSGVDDAEEEYRDTPISNAIVIISSSNDSQTGSTGLVAGISVLSIIIIILIIIIIILVVLLSIKRTNRSNKEIQKSTVQPVEEPIYEIMEDSKNDIEMKECQAYEHVETSPQTQQGQQDETDVYETV